MGGCLQIKLEPWKRVALTRAFALGPALLVAASASSNQKLFNNINEYLNILQSVQLPFAVLPTLHFAASVGSVELAKALVEAGAAIETRDDKNVYPAVYAFNLHHDGVVAYLREVWQAKAKTMKQGRGGRSLGRAASAGFSTIDAKK